MNKTININLANIFFHVDENAYSKLQGYLDAIKRSFAGTPGGDEIMADIEARIAELFTERQKDDRQVITLKEIDEVIAIMGQPEDYMVDEEIFSDEEPARSTSGTYKQPKKLYRDTENQYISGVSSGLSHYLGIDVLWVRLLFIFVTVFSGFGIVAYILLWILVPEASTTAEKIAMTGKPVNISNIEKKIKEGFDTVTEKVKNVDYEKVGKSVKDGSRGFFDTLGSLFTMLFRVVGKFVGIILIIVAAVTLIGLLVGLFTAGSVNLFGGPHWQELVMMNVDAPLWLISLMVFFAVGIPFFILFYLGLKILINNLNSLGRVAQFSLLAIWIISIAGLISLGIQQTTQRVISGKSSETRDLTLTGADTLTISVKSDPNFNSRFFNNSDFDIVSVSGDKFIYSDEVEFWIRKSNESNSYVEIQRRAKGATYDDAFARAEKIVYNLDAENNEVTVDDFWTTQVENKYREQEVIVTFYLMPGVRVKFNSPSHQYFRTIGDKGYTDYLQGRTRHIYEITEDNRIRCLDCESELSSEKEPETETETEVEDPAVKDSVSEQNREVQNI